MATPIQTNSKNEAQPLLSSNTNSMKKRKKLSLIKAAFVLFTAILFVYLSDCFYKYFYDKYMLRWQTDSFLVKLVSVMLSKVGIPILKNYVQLPTNFWSSEIKVQGLTSNVTIARDKMGTFYVTAGIDQDVYFGQGFVHATENAFRLHCLRLLARGELATQVGQDVLDADVFSRTLGLTRVSKSRLKNLLPAEMDVIKGYTMGVNAALKQLPATPIEFVLTQQPLIKDWTLEDTMLTISVSMFMLSRGLASDLVAYYLQKKLGDMWNDFRPNSIPNTPAINPEGNSAVINDLDVQFKKPIKDDMWAWHTFRNPLDAAKHERAHEGYSFKLRDYPIIKMNTTKTEAISLEWSGSNGWAVSGRFTETGKPLLAGDTHSPLFLPGFWIPMMLDIKSRSIESNRIIGGSVVGIPGIFAGHNQYAAWTPTIAHLDLDDTFLLNVTKDGTKYECDGKLISFDFEEHLIHAKGMKEPIPWTVRISRFGPIISDAIGVIRKTLPENQVMAMSSVVAKSPSPLFWIAHAAKTSSVQHLIQTSSTAQCCQFSLPFVTNDGTVGALITGAVPKRKFTENMFHDGSTMENGWKGLHPLNEIPYIVNPKDGIVAAANSLLAYNAEEKFGNIYTPGERVSRIKNYLLELSQKKKISVDDLAIMQLDLYSFGGEKFHSIVSSFLNDISKTDSNGSLTFNPQSKCAKRGLTKKNYDIISSNFLSWNFQLDAHSIGGSIFQVWVQTAFQKLMEANNVDDETTLILLGGPLSNIWIPRNEFTNHWRHNLFNQMQLDGKSRWIPAVGSTHDLLCDSGIEALQWLQERYGDVKYWEWGKLRTRYMDHDIGKAVPILRDTLSVGPMSGSGDFGTINVNHVVENLLKRNPVRGTYSGAEDAPSFRMIIDSSDWNNSKWIVPAGTSGWIHNSKYSDLIDDYRDGKLLPMLWDKQSIKNATVSELTLHST